jgi:hypothetical protein
MGKQYADMAKMTELEEKSFPLYSILYHFSRFIVNHAGGNLPMEILG